MELEGCVITLLQHRDQAGFKEKEIPTLFESLLSPPFSGFILWHGEPWTFVDMDKSFFSFLPPSILFLLSFLFYFWSKSHPVAQATLELTKEPSLVSKLRPSPLVSWVLGFTSMGHPGPAWWLLHNVENGSAMALLPWRPASPHSPTILGVL